MKISNAGLELIKKFEGCRLTAYKDSVGVWTIGYGTTTADKAITGTIICQGLQISQIMADEWLRKSVDQKYGPKVDKYSKYEWNQNEFDALVSFTYNVGSIDGLTASGSRSKEDIADKILAYNRAGGKVLPGLTRRRQEERALFVTPVKKEGWVKEDGGHWRFYCSGKYVRNEWYQDGDKWYWFDGAGHMVRDTWRQCKGSWYYLGFDGAMIKGCVKAIGSEVFAFGKDGAMLEGEIKLKTNSRGAITI